MAEEKSKLFEKENRLYKFYLNDLEGKKTCIDFVRDLFKLELITFDKSENLDLVKLYNVVGFDAFFEICGCFSSKTIKIPNIEKMKKNLIIALAYYHVVMLGMPPKEVGRILSEKLGSFNLKQKSIKNIINKLQAEIEELGARVTKEAQNGRND